MNRACAGQTVLDLFPAPPRDHVEDTLKWMCDVHGCIRGEIEGEVRELYRDFGTVEAFDAVDLEAARAQSADARAHRDERGADVPREGRHFLERALRLLGREKAPDYRDREDDHGEEREDLYGIVYEKVQSRSERRGLVEPEGSVYE